METKKLQYTPAELVFAAFSRCPCGAGLAYPRDAKPYGDSAYWDCSAILCGTAIEIGQPGSVKHTDKLPFVFYEVKSEGQPSANGATTRPTEDDVARLARAIAEARAEIANADALESHFAKRQTDLDADRQRWVDRRTAAEQRLRELGAT